MHDLKRNDKNELMYKTNRIISSVQSRSYVWLFATPWMAVRQASLSITNSRSSLKLTSIESVMPSNHLILCHPLLLPPSVFPNIRVFSNESVLHIRWPKYWNLSFSFSPTNEYSGLISLGWTGWISFQFKGISRVFSNTTIRKHQFFNTQLSLYSNSHIHTWLLEKTIALTKWTFVGKGMSLFFNMLSRLVITFLPRTKHLLIHGCCHHLQWFWNPQNKACHCFHCFPIYLPWSNGTRCHDLSFLNVEF